MHCIKSQPCCIHTHTHAYRTGGRACGGVQLFIIVTSLKTADGWRYFRFFFFISPHVDDRFLTSFGDITYYNSCVCFFYHYTHDSNNIWSIESKICVWRYEPSNEKVDAFVLNRLPILSKFCAFTTSSYRRVCVLSAFFYPFYLRFVSAV